MEISVSYLFATSFVLFLSVWKCFSNAILLVSYTRQKSRTFRSFAMNIICLTINAFFQGLFGILAAVIGFLAMTNGIGTYTCSVPMILFFFSIVDESWRTLYVFIQQCLAFSRRRIKPDPKQIVLVNLCLLVGSLICLGIPLQVWTRDDPFQRWRACTTAVFVNSSTALGYFACLTGLPGLLSVVLYTCLQLHIRRRSTEVVELNNVELSTRKIRSAEDVTPNSLGKVRLETNIQPINSVFTTSASGDLKAAENIHKEQIPIPEANLEASVSPIVCERQRKLTNSKEERFTGKQQLHKRGVFTAQTRALKTMAIFLLLNTSLTIQYFLVWLVYYIWPHLTALQYIHTFSFVLLYFNTSLNMIVIVKRYTIVRESVLDMLRDWKAMVMCTSCHRRD